MEDNEAAYLISCRDKVHLELLGSNKGTADIVNNTGLTPEETAKAIHSLKSDNYIETTGLGEFRIHVLTIHGKLNAPPPPLPDFNSKECDPRPKKKHSPRAKNKMRISGHRHFHGVPGKFPIDKDGAIVLKPGTIIGKVWEAIETPRSINDLYAMFPDIPEKSLSNSIYSLRKMGLSESTKGARDTRSMNRRTETRARIFADESEPSKAEVIYKDTPAPQIAKTQTKIQTDLKILYTRYSKSELITEIALDLADELEQLKKLRQQMQAISH